MEISNDLIDALSKKTKKPWHHHLLLVALFSALIFGSIVVLLGSWLQHKNWKEEKRIATLIGFYKKTFDKRADIVREVFYLNELNKINC